MKSIMNYSGCAPGRLYKGFYSSRSEIYSFDDSEEMQSRHDSARCMAKTNAKMINACVMTDSV